MEKKYYDLIISLIKEHKKYPGCEAILEEIANDVFEHSKVVIGSIPNEDVIVAYLNKVISTSIITVPKKLNFNTKTRHRVITIADNVQIAQKPMPQTEPVILQEANLADNVQNNLNEAKLFVAKEDTLPIQVEESDVVETKESSFDESIVSSDTEELEEDEFEVADLTYDTELTENNDIVEETAGSEFEEINLPEMTVEPNEITFEEDVLNENTYLQTSDVHQDMVDRMINGVPSEPSLSEKVEIVAQSEAVDSFELSENIYAGNEEVLSEDDSSENLMEESDDFLAEDDSSENLMEESDDFLAEDDDSESLMEESDDLLAEDDSSENLMEESDDLLAEDDSSENLMEESDDLLAEDDSSVNLMEESDSLLEFNDEIPAFDLEESSSLAEEITPLEEERNSLSAESETEQTTSDFQKPSYACFNYEPEKPDYDTEEIISYIEELDKKHPEKQYLKVCQLKYKQKLSVTQIAENLNFKEENVLEILNEIIDTVKD